MARGEITGLFVTLDWARAAKSGVAPADPPSPSIPTNPTESQFVCVGRWSEIETVADYGR